MHRLDPFVGLCVDLKSVRCLDEGFNQRLHINDIRLLLNARDALQLVLKRRYFLLVSSLLSFKGL